MALYLHPEEIVQLLTKFRARAGAYIILLVRDAKSDAALSIQSEIISRYGGTCVIYHCDLFDRKEVLSVVPRLFLDRHEVDMFIHSGGVQHRCPAEDFPDEEWDKIMSANLTAGFQLARALGKHWLEKSLKGFGIDSTKRYQRKKIIFIASVITFTGSVEIPAYAASKGAIGSLTKALNNEWMSKGINVNAIAPGYIQTDLTSAIKEDPEKERKILDRIPAGRWGNPDDLAGAVIHLCAKSGDYIGGEIHAVDGGFLGR